jgi:septal ring factor EnvC (AmiA/AmiB activator)
MAKKENKPVNFVVEPEYVDQVRSLLKQLRADERPAKPIKRKVNFTEKELDALVKQIKEMSPKLKALEKEHDRLQDSYDRRLTSEDEKWLDKQTMLLGAVLELAKEKLDVYFY